LERGEEVSEHGKITVQEPDWLKLAITDEIRQLNLIQQGKLPDVLLGRFIVTGARRLLRCVYGSDLNAAAALRQMVIDDEIDSLNRCKHCDRMLMNQINAGVFDGPIPRCEKHSQEVTA
jgi:hypothetical protein